MAAPQSYQTHKKYVMGFHGFTFLLIAILLVWSVRLVGREPSLANAMQLVLVVVLGMLFWYSRVFAMGVQDRVIRLEESLRLSRLLPPELQSRIDELRVRHLVALRFASDGEVTDLVRRVLGGELTTPDAIKRSIKVWRPDHLRA